MAIAKQLYEAQLQQIICMLLENKTNEQIASELKISVRTVQNYKQRIDKRYGDFQRSKTGNTLFMECQLFKNRMLSLYKGLERVVTSQDDRNVSGTKKAKCAEVAANICIDVLKMESEGIRAIKKLGLVAAKKNNALLNNLRNDNNDEVDDDSNGHVSDNNSRHHNQQQQHHQEQEENDNRKF
jgi:hypothetical protein